MSKNAPDTRNRIDTQKNSEKRFAVVKKSEQKPRAKREFQPRESRPAVAPKKAEKAVPEKSNGQLFKEKNLFSKTAKRLMQKKGLVVSLESVPVLRLATKARKKAEAKVKAAKHDKAKAGRKGKAAKNAPKQTVKKAA